MLVALAAISAALLSPYGSRESIPGQPDLANALGYVIQAGMALKEGQFPIRIAPVELDGMRYPGFQFYSPFTYTILGLFDCVLRDPWLSVKMGVFLAILSASWFFFATLFSLTSSVSISIITASAYICSPALLINLYSRGAIAEAFGQCLIPISLWAIFRFYRSPDTLRLLLAALTLCCLFLAHLITGLLFTGSILLLALLSTLFSSSYTWLLPRTLCVVLTATGLLAYHLIPLRSVDRLNISNDILRNPLKGERLTTLPGILAPTSVSPLPGGVPGSPGLHPAIGVPGILGIFLLAHQLFQTSPRKWPFERLGPAALLTWLVVFFAAWSPMDFWQYLPHSIYVIQFPYRIFTQVQWLGLLALALGLTPWLKDPDDGNPLPAAAGVALTAFFATCYLYVPANSFKIQSVIKGPGLGDAAYLERLTLDTSGYYEGHEIALTYPGRWMKLETDFQLERSLILKEPAAVLRLTGTLSNEGEFATTANPPMRIRLISRDKAVAGQTITTRDFVWDVPFREIAKAFGPQDEAIPLRYALAKRLVPHELNPLNADARILGIHPAAVTLQKLPRGSERLIDATRKQCSSSGVLTACRFALDSDSLVQLPVLYYRDFLEVRVNGRVSPYTARRASLRERPVLLTEVALKKGESRVEVEFVGSRTGNWISCLTLAALTTAGLVEIARVHFLRRKSA